LLRLLRLLRLLHLLRLLRLGFAIALGPVEKLQALMVSFSFRLVVVLNTVAVREQTESITH
jgi:hypothetical protein